MSPRFSNKDWSDFDLTGRQLEAVREMPPGSLPVGSTKKLNA